MDVAPFRAVRYDPRIAGDAGTTSAPAYDEVERLTYAAHRAASPYTVLELLTPRADPDPYAAASATLARWWRTGVLRQDAAPALYVYEQHELRGGVPAVQRGVLAAVRLPADDAADGLLPHERVDDARVRARLERLRAVPLDLSPVFAVHDRAPGLQTLLAEGRRARPIAALSDEDGVDHRVWALRDAAVVASVRACLAGRGAVIADGHHRWATALAYRDLRRAETGGAPGPWEHTLAYLVDASVDGPRVEPIHRVVRHLPPDAEARLAALCDLKPGPTEAVALQRAVRAAGAGTVGLWRSGRALLLRLRDPEAVARRLPAGRSAAWRRLDAALFEHALAPLLGPGVETQPRADVAAAAADVAADPSAGLFLLAPPRLATVLSLAGAGEPLPAKSTSFRPKPRTGLVMRAVEPPPP